MRDFEVWKLIILREIVEHVLETQSGSTKKGSDKTPLIGTWLGVGSTDSDRVEGRQLLLLLENTGGGGNSQESVGGEEVVAWWEHRRILHTPLHLLVNRINQRHHNLEKYLPLFSLFLSQNGNGIVLLKNHLSLFYDGTCFELKNKKIKYLLEKLRRTILAKHFKLLYHLSRPQRAGHKHRYTLYPEEAETELDEASAAGSKLEWSGNSDARAVNTVGYRMRSVTIIRMAITSPSSREAQWWRTVGVGNLAERREIDSDSYAPPYIRFREVFDLCPEPISNIRQLTAEGSPVENEDFRIDWHEWSVGRKALRNGLRRLMRRKAPKEIKRSFVYKIECLHRPEAERKEEGRRYPIPRWQEKDERDESLQGWYEGAELAETKDQERRPESTPKPV
ncbi:hypothetical protein WN51_02116 [Melipona quadrifasciata]|uniref:Uncharacterized protein n=1 Tax=Melipona quadrifasciata TaxID=166423 RepID=A0A0M8ZWW8_9HYME|nr:hypothetical protein WN51_02116 [Melipona quadrifasciata]